MSASEGSGDLESHDGRHGEAPCPACFQSCARVQSSDALSLRLRSQRLALGNGGARCSAQKRIVRVVGVGSGFGFSFSFGFGEAEGEVEGVAGGEALRGSPSLQSSSARWMRRKRHFERLGT